LSADAVENCYFVAAASKILDNAMFVCRVLLQFVAVVNALWVDDADSVNTLVIIRHLGYVEVNGIAKSV
jgi:hypothetical protein